MRRRLRPLAQALRHGGAVLQLQLLRLSAVRAGVVLMYHRVEPRQGDPWREFTPPVAVALFERHLRHLRRHYDVVGAVELRARVAARRRGQRFPVAVTFDDDTRSHVDHAAPLLARLGLPATFFLNGHALDAPRAYWWERLQSAFDASGSWDAVLPGPVMTTAREWAADGEVGAYHVSEAVERLPTAEREALSLALRDRLGGDDERAGLRGDDVRALVTGGFEVGFHGHTHAPLSLLDAAAMERELDGGRDELAAAAGAPLRTIAYPHGKAGEREGRASAERGFVAGFTVVDEAVTPTSDPLLQGRLDAQLPSTGHLAWRMVRQLRGAR